MAVKVRDNRISSGDEEGKLKKLKQQDQKGDDGHDETELGDMLQELRILLQGLQVLTAFLIILPFNEGFREIDQVEKWVYMTTFLCAITGLVLLSAPAAQHRLQRPLMDRVRFKELATRMIIIGLIPSSVALVLATQLVISQAIGLTESFVAAGLVTVLIGLLWWILPLAHKEKA
ncbi:MAG: DUF6328 family protein [Chloroflexota bacterium]|nr:DUF6328 family protein [Chloroflexota bacterium]MDQ5865008.1 DUF6328 family protein [Chloroflexota bacterium]